MKEHIVAFNILKSKQNFLYLYLNKNSSLREVGLWQSFKGNPKKDCFGTKVPRNDDKRVSNDNGKLQ